MSTRRTRRTFYRTVALLGLALGALAPIACRGSRPAPAAPRPIVGVKIYEAAPPFDALFRAWRDLGVNTAFVSEGLLGDAEFRAAAKADGVKLFLIFPVFQDPEAIKADPGLAAIDAAGRPAKDEWVEFVCPAREEFLRRKIDRLKTLVAAGDPYAVSLDFIRYFVFWEKWPRTATRPACRRRASARSAWRASRKRWAWSSPRP